MSQDLSTQQNTKISLFDPSQFNHWLDVAKQLSSSTLIPKNYMGKPMDILVAMELGRSLGLSMMQSIQSIAVINGRPSLYGDAILAICQSHPSYEYIIEVPILEKEEIMGYKCTIKRKHHEEHTVIFTISDAKKANLWEKTGPWSQYPLRMLQIRARDFALRNTFADALTGIHIAEESQDLDKSTIIEGSKSNKRLKMDSLLEKKGFNDANITTVNNDYADTSPVNDAGNVHYANNLSAGSTVENRVPTQVDEDRTAQDSIADATHASMFCTEAQLEVIENMMTDLNFDHARKLKALHRFNVTDFKELSVDNADKMIAILYKTQ
jgi:hypothetical protein